MQPYAKPRPIVVAIKLLHTAVWLFFVACIVAVPVAAGLHRFQLAGVTAALVLLECLVLGLNRCHCPLSDLASRFTPETKDNFDIYLPNWLARHNKAVFGILFAAGGLFALAQWLLFNR